MNESPRKRPGRPKKEGGPTKAPVTITLTLLTIEYIDSQSDNRSEFIEQCVTEHRERKEK